MELTLEPALEHRIRQRAYEIWHDHGRADGHAHEHWVAAEREVLASLSAPASAPEASTPPQPAKRAAPGSRAVAPRAAASRKKKS